MSEEALKIYSEGCSAFAAGNYELAESKFTKAIALDPTNQDVRIDKGMVLERQGKLDDALREYDDLLELYPNCGTAWIHKAMILNNLRFPEEAEMCADNGLRLNFKDSDAWGQKGRALEMQHKINEAMVCYDEQIRLAPAEGWARKGAMFAFEICDYENAIICFEKALLIDSHNWWAWNGKGAAYYSLGLFEEAVQCFDKLLKAFPRNLNGWNNKGIVLTFQGNFQEAEKCFQTASKLAPSYTEHFISLGYLYLHQGKFQEALKWFEKALAVGQLKDFAAQGKVLCEHLMSNPRPTTCPDPTGKKSLQKLDKLNQTELYFYRGKTLVIFGEVEEAKKAFEKCLELNPNYKAAAIEIDKIKTTTQFSVTSIKE